MSGGFTVSTEQLRAHAATVRGVATDVGAAADAAHEVGYGGMVFGILFDGPAWAFLRPWADSMHTSIAAAEASGQAIATALGRNADTYDGVEDGNRTTITQAGPR